MNNNQRILLTGANGFIGKAIRKYYSNKSPLLSISRLTTKTKNFDYIPFENLFEESTFKKILEFSPTHVIHCASIAHSGEPKNKKENDKLNEININFSKKLSELSKKLKIHRFLYLSSVGVHGSQVEFTIDNPLNEKSPLNPQNKYSLSKLACERLLINSFENTDIQLNILRPSLVYGEESPGNIRSLVQAIDNRIPLPLKSVKNKRSFLSIDNLIDAIHLINLHPLAYSKTYVLADSETTSTANFIKNISKSRNIKDNLFPLPPKYFKNLKNIPYFGRKFNQLISDFVVDSSLIRKELSWVQPFSQKESIKKYFSK